MKSYTIGESRAIKKLVTKDVVQQFADFSGDRNPVHLDEEFAAKTIFKRNIAHGMIAGSYISAVIGMDFPGPGTIYLSQNFIFKRPVFVGDEIEIIVTVKDIIVDKNRLVLKTDCINQNGELVLQGEALVKAP